MRKGFERRLGNNSNTIVKEWLKKHDSYGGDLSWEETLELMVLALCREVRRNRKSLESNND